MTPEEYKRVMEGYSYKEHLDSPSEFWHGEPGAGMFGESKWVWRYYEPNVSVMHHTDSFYRQTDIDKGKFLHDLKTENKHDDSYIYRRFEKGILRISKTQKGVETA
jgi:hypothetical protein